MLTKEMVEQIIKDSGLSDVLYVKQSGSSFEVAMKHNDKLATVLYTDGDEDYAVLFIEAFSIGMLCATEIYAKAAGFELGGKK